MITPNGIIQEAPGAIRIGGGLPLNTELSYVVQVRAEGQKDLYATLHRDI